MLVLILFTLATCLNAWENLPSIPAGRRAEYYLLHDDGAYKFGYDTGDGQSALVNADARNEVQGKYSYTDNNGKRVSLSYTAGNEGFVPSLDGTALSSQSGTLRKEGSTINTISSSEQNVQNNPGNDDNTDASYSFTIDTDTYKRKETSDSKGNINSQYSYSSPDGGVNNVKFIAGAKSNFLTADGNANLGSSLDNVGEISRKYPVNSLVHGAPSYNNLKPDGSYSFSYSTPEQTREESSDADNNVSGRFTFKSPDSANFHHVEYKASAKTGFVAKGSHLPNSAPSVESSSLTSPQTSASFDRSYNLANIKSSQPFVSETADGSYSFSYAANDHTHQQSADSQNNVVGSFSFRAPDDNQLRRVDYKAGSATGFVASGSHLPERSNILHSETHSGEVRQSNDDSVIVRSSDNVSLKSQGILNDRSYSFSYKTPDQSRVETSDSRGNVEGSFSFIAPDGQNRITDYHAGSKTGFIAVGSHLPSINENSKLVTPQSSYSRTLSPLHSAGSIPSSLPKNVINNDGSYSFSFSTPDQNREESADTQNNVHGSYSFKSADGGNIHRVDYKSEARTGFIAHGDHLPTAVSAVSSNQGQLNTNQNSLNNKNSFPVSSRQFSVSDVSSRTTDLHSIQYPSIPASKQDGSYSFSYNTGEQSRAEEGDTQGNVQGSFSFVAKDDGKLRKVEYEAGAEKGFIAKGEHLPVSPDAPESKFTATPSSSYLTPVLGNQGTLSQSSYGNTNTRNNENNNDASYSYSYQTDTSSKQEQSDAQGNVIGSFSFIDGDGKSRSVHYTAKDNEGFIAEGEHLPKPISTAPNISLIGPSSRKSTVISSQDSNGRTNESRSPSLNVQRYLPPQSPHKFGYVFDSKN